jgi:hypothetical protein
VTVFPRFPLVGEVEESWLFPAVEEVVLSPKRRKKRRRRKRRFVL